MKSDFAVFSGYYGGMILGTLGILLGVFILAHGSGFGVLVIITSIFLGKYLIFKARRGKGHVVYYGGRYGKR